MTLKVFWQPAGETLDSIGTKRLVDISDGDTPNIRMNVRMLSIDTPETSGSSAIQGDIDGLAGWLESDESPVWRSLADHLVRCLRRPDGRDAVDVHVEQGHAAKAHFEAIAQARLERPGRTPRSLFVRTADERFDGYGRLLAYVAPSYSREERAHMSRRERATFNFDMVAGGWAAPFILFPSIPGELDLPLFREAARSAVAEGRGAWSDERLLLGYEYRTLKRLAELRRDILAGEEISGRRRYGWIERYCADMTSGKIYAPQDYVQVAPYDRIFVWPRDVRRAVAELNLEPGGRLAD